MEQLRLPCEGLKAFKMILPHLPAEAPSLLLSPPGQLAEKRAQLNRPGKVCLCSAGLPFKGLFEHDALISAVH